MNTPSTALYTVTDDESGMQANVVLNTNTSHGTAGQYNVCVKDMDSGETLPVVRIYPTLDWAKAEADKAVRP